MSSLSFIQLDRPIKLRSPLNSSSFMASILLTNPIRQTSAGLIVSSEPIGPTGVTCRDPHCADEADHRLTIDGTGIAGETAKLCCADHARAVASDHG